MDERLGIFQDMEKIHKENLSPCSLREGRWRLEKLKPVWNKNERPQSIYWCGLLSEEKGLRHGQVVRSWNVLCPIIVEQVPPPKSVQG